MDNSFRVDFLFFNYHSLFGIAVLCNVILEYDMYLYLIILVLLNYKVFNHTIYQGSRMS